MRKEVEQLWTLVEPPIRGAGLELVELEWNREAEGWVLRVYIDQPWDGQFSTTESSNDERGVSFPECERVSRDLSATLDVADVIPHAYRLEVSSPGLDRPLRRSRDFARFAGQQVKVRTVEMVEGRRNFSGTIRGADSQSGVVEVECDGRSYQLPVNVIARAHLVPDWEAEFRRGGNEKGRASPESPRGTGRGPDGPPGNRPYRSAS
jgi:ribosome maturation factor RimP